MSRETQTTTTWTEKEKQVRARLRWIIASILAASLSFTLIFVKQNIVPDETGVLLLFSLPIVFGLHVTEEFIFPGGFISWDNVFRPQFTDTPGSFYVKVNAFPALAALLVVLGAFDYRGHYSHLGIRGWFTFVTFAACNTLFHVRGAIHTRRYSPGMVTALCLYLPLTILSYVHFLKSGTMDLASTILCIGVALAIQPILDLIKNRTMKHA